ncbi:MAG: hypothetical protein ACSLE6_07150 [Mycobacterium sp.]
MLRPIEIRANIEGDVARALAMLGDPDPADTRRVWFLEARRGLHAGRLDMLSRGVIIRFRCGSDGNGSTATLRLSDADNLVDEWAQPFTTAAFTYRVESDWSGDRRAVAASAEISHPRGALIEALGADNLEAILNANQRKLLRDCAHIDVESERLDALGPIASARWQDLWVGAASDVDAERWTVLDLDFLELSVRVKPGDDEPAEGSNGYRCGRCRWDTGR